MCFSASMVYITALEPCRRFLSKSMDGDSNSLGEKQIHHSIAWQLVDHCLQLLNQMDGHLICTPKDHSMPNNDRSKNYYKQSFEKNKFQNLRYLIYKTVTKIKWKKKNCKPIKKYMNISLVLLKGNTEIKIDFMYRLTQNERSISVVTRPTYENSSFCF